jgi:adenosine deaminase CECR1
MAALVTEYLQKREALIAQDRSLRVDARFNFESGDVRQKADEVVRRIELVEGENVWNQQHEGVSHSFPGMEFLTGAQAGSTVITMSADSPSSRQRHDPTICSRLFD